jgi:hypothetical protein
VGPRGRAGTCQSVLPRPGCSGWVFSPTCPSPASGPETALHQSVDLSILGKARNSSQGCEFRSEVNLGTLNSQAVHLLPEPGWPPRPIFGAAPKLTHLASREPSFLLIDVCSTFGFICLIFEKGSHHLAQAGLKLMTLLTQALSATTPSSTQVLISFSVIFGY